MATTAFAPTSRFGDSTVGISVTSEDVGVRLNAVADTRWILHQVTCSVNSQFMGLELTISIDAVPRQIYQAFDYSPQPLHERWNGWPMPINTQVQFEMLTVDLPGPPPVPLHEAKYILVSLDNTTNQTLPAPSSLVEYYVISTGAPVLGAAAVVISSSY